ncbi:MarR family winged helix-turn-helix transcriptional regulator [Lentzea sp. NPDC051208]|uniref:MarR family winged helix-turn-helix transcriptional regulator n=1 Tax=Lentzea sp. NPDC051208 TaxID=3154642 RepID=UPI0034361D1E
MTEARPSAEPRWLTSAEMDAWLNVTQLLMLLPTALDRQLRDDAGLPHAHYRILTMLSAERDGSMRMTQLARRAGTTTTRLSHAVSVLEERGWVERSACPTDRRGQVARLTADGWNFLRSAAPGHVAEVRRLVFDHLTEDDVARLREITAKLLPPLTDNA